MSQQEEIRALMQADTTLSAVSLRMAEEFQQHGLSWPRDWMQKHVNERAAILMARNVLLDRLESLSGGPNEVTTPKPEPAESISGAPSVTSKSGEESAESPAAS